MGYASADEANRIGTVRIRAPADNLALRLKLSSWLGRAEMRPANFPPGAVLVIKRLVDPKPGCLALSLDAARIDSFWERAVQDAVSEIYARAVRPAWNSVPTDAEAVLFADTAEMLACLAIDLIRSEAPAYWWWRSLLRNASYGGMELLSRLLLDRPEALPAVLYHLAKRDQAIVVVDAFTEEQANALLASVCRAFCLPDLTAELSPASRFSRVKLSNGDAELADLAGIDTVDGTEQHRKSSEIQTRPPFSTQPKLKPPWARWFPVGVVVPEQLPLEKACLLGVGLALYHTPAAIRSDRFLGQYRAWLDEVRSLQLLTTMTAEKTEFQAAPLPTMEHSAVVAEAADRAEASMQRFSETKQPDFEAALRDVKHSEINTGRNSDSLRAETVSAVLITAGDQQKAVDDQVFTAKGEYREWPQNSVPPVAEPSLTFPVKPDSSANSGPNRKDSAFDRQETRREERIAPALDGYEGNQAGINTTEMVSRASEPAVVETEWALQLEGGVDSGLGGAFYLINLMAYLDLPDCFEADWQLASDVGAWGVLNLLCRALLDETANQDLAADPIWPVLAVLAGIELGELPGAALAGCEEFRLPLAWPLFGADDAQPQAFAWAADVQSLWLWSEEGWLIADVLLSGEPAESQAQNLAAAYASDFILVWRTCAEIPLAHFRGSLLAGLNPALLRWLERVIPYLRFHLQRTLKWSQDGSLTGLLFYHPAKVYVSSLHVDVFMSLNDILLALRMAGLDRDPGWLPEFGRVVLLHFD